MQLPELLNTEKHSPLPDQPETSVVVLLAVSGSAVLVLVLVTCICWKKNSSSDGDSRRDTVPLDDLLSKPSLADPESVFSEAGSGEFRPIPGAGNWFVPFEDENSFVIESGIAPATGHGHGNMGISHLSVAISSDPDQTKSFPPNKRSSMTTHVVNTSKSAHKLDLEQPNLQNGHNVENEANSRLPSRRLQLTANYNVLADRRLYQVNANDTTHPAGSHKDITDTTHPAGSHKDITDKVGLDATALKIHRDSLCGQTAPFLSSTRCSFSHEVGHIVHGNKTQRPSLPRTEEDESGQADARPSNDDSGQYRTTPLSVEMNRLESEALTSADLTFDNQVPFSGQDRLVRNETTDKAVKMSLSYPRASSQDTHTLTRDVANSKTNNRCTSPYNNCQLPHSTSIVTNQMSPGRPSSDLDRCQSRGVTMRRCLSCVPGDPVYPDPTIRGRRQTFSLNLQIDVHFDSEQEPETVLCLPLTHTTGSSNPATTDTCPQHVTSFSIESNNNIKEHNINRISQSGSDGDIYTKERQLEKSFAEKSHHRGAPTLLVSAKRSSEPIMAEVNQVKTCNTRQLMISETQSVISASPKAAVFRPEIASRPNIASRNKINLKPEIVARSESALKPEIVARSEINLKPEIVARSESAPRPKCAPRNEITPKPQIVPRTKIALKPDIVLKPETAPTAEIRTPVIQAGIDLADGLTAPKSANSCRGETTREVVTTSANVMASDSSHMRVAAADTEAKVDRTQAADAVVGKSTAGRVRQFFQPQPESANGVNVVMETDRLTTGTAIFTTETEKSATDKDMSVTETGRFATKTDSYLTEPGRYATEINSYMTETDKSANDIDRQRSVVIKTVGNNTITPNGSPASKYQQSYDIIHTSMETEPGEFNIKSLGEVMDGERNVYQRKSLLLSGKKDDSAASRDARHSQSLENSCHHRPVRSTPREFSTDNSHHHPEGVGKTEAVISVGRADSSALSEAKIDKPASTKAAVSPSHLYKKSIHPKTHVDMKLNDWSSELKTDLDTQLTEVLSETETGRRGTSLQVFTDTASETGRRGTSLQVFTDTASADSVYRPDEGFPKQTASLSSVASKCDIVSSTATDKERPARTSLQKQKTKNVPSHTTTSLDMFPIQERVRPSSNMSENTKDRRQAVLFDDMKNIKSESVQRVSTRETRAAESRGAESRVAESQNAVCVHLVRIQGGDTAGVEDRDIIITDDMMSVCVSMRPSNEEDDVAMKHDGDAVTMNRDEDDVTTNRDGDDVTPNRDGDDATPNRDGEGVTSNRDGDDVTSNRDGDGVAMKESNCGNQAMKLDKDGPETITQCLRPELKQQLSENALDEQFTVLSPKHWQVKAEVGDITVPKPVPRSVYVNKETRQAPVVTDMSTSSAVTINIEDSMETSDGSEESDYDNPWDSLDEAVKRASVRYNRRPSRIAAGDNKTLLLKSAEDLGRLLEEADKKRQLRQTRNSCQVVSPETDSMTIPFTRFSPHRHTVKDLVSQSHMTTAHSTEYILKSEMPAYPQLGLLRQGDVTANDHKGLDTRRPMSLTSKVRAKITSPEIKQRKK